MSWIVSPQTSYIGTLRTIAQNATLKKKISPLKNEEVKMKPWE